MAVDLEVAARNAACDAIVDLIDGGSGDTEGDLVIMTAAEAADLVIIPLAATAFGNSSSGVATMDNVSAATATGDGTAATALFRNKANARVLGGSVSVTGGAGDVELSSITIATDDTVTMTNAATTFTVPAS